MNIEQQPQFKTLAELFSAIGPYNDAPRNTLPQMDERKNSGRISGYLVRSHGPHQGFTATLTPELISWVQSHMLNIDNDTIHFQFVVWRWTDDGKMSADGKGAVAQINVFAKYNVILGSRLLAQVSEAEFNAMGVTVT